MKRLLFNWKAQNAHGLHSPLIYQLYTEVINPTYQKKGDFLTLLQQELIIFFKNYSLTKVDVIRVEGEIDLTHDSALYIVPSIRSRMGQQAWKNLIKSPNIIFSVELFELGLLFMFPKAPKQDFILKKS
ncbi:MAG: hypothetical protein RI903_848 [Bacteroidota bacterium]|jgi:hypothetical protein